MKNRIYILFIISFIVISSCSGELSKAELLSSYKIVSYKDKRVISYNSFIDSLASYDVIFLGELHNNKEIHYLELKIVKDLDARSGSLAIALEMFERDTQGAIDSYLAGKIDETLFLLRSRPWSNYISDYKGIVEYAKAHSIRLIGMNAPRSILKGVLRGGEEYAKGLYDADTAWLADTIDWNNHIYRDYFYNYFPSGGHKIHFSFNNFFIASLLKDTTMAKAISELLLSGFKVISINGRFHSDYGIAIPNELRKLIPNVKVGIVSFLLSEESKVAFYLSEPMKLADYLISIER